MIASKLPFCISLRGSLGIGSSSGIPRLASRRTSRSASEAKQAVLAATYNYNCYVYIYIYMFTFIRLVIMLYIYIYILVIIVKYIRT